MTPTPRIMTHRRRRLSAAIIAAALLVGCSSDDGEQPATISAETTTESISIELPRTPRPDADQTTTPVYGILVNDSTLPMRVVSATSSVADSVDLLGPDDSVQLPSDGFLVQPDGGFVMEAVGFKLMLMGIDPAGISDQIPVTLRFESGDTFAFNANVIDE